MAWAPPEPAAGGVGGAKLLVPEEPLVREDPVEPEVALGKVADGVAARADFDADGDADEAAVRVAVPDGTGLAVACADPGRVMATAPAVMTLAAVTVVVTERILA